MRREVTNRTSDARVAVLVLCSLVLLTVTAWLPTAGSKSSGLRISANERQANAGGQHRKVVDQERNYPNQPVEIVGLKISGKPAELNEGIKVDEESEWIRGLSWEIRNRSNKNILSIDLFVMFPDTQANGGRMFVCTMHYGNDPKAHPSGDSGVAEPLKPNTTIRFTVSDGMYVGIKKHLESTMPLSDVNHVRVRPELIIFDDDTAWSMGEEMHRDPDKPSRWIPNN